MAYLDNEADLAGVIGHEIGHVTARHGAQRATRQQDAGLGVLAAGILGAVLESQGYSGVGQLAGQVSQTVASGYIASYGREQELQADGLGAEYLSRTRFDPHNMIDVIKVLKNQERFAADQAQIEGRPAPKQNDWLASHPSNDQRLQSMTDLASQYRGTYDDDGRARYLKVIDGLQFGDSTDQGFTRGRNFYHLPLGLAITAPQGWQIQNSAEQLAVTNAAGDAALLVRLVPPGAGKNHADILKAIYKPTQGRTDALTINGLSATHFVGVAANATGQAQAVEATVVSGPGEKMYVLQYSARDAQTLQRLRATLAEAQASFRALTPQDRTAAKPWGVKLLPYPGGGFAELARTSPIARPEQQLRLINGYYAGGEPKVGQLVKVIVAP
jgi:predicted Zn-dependent protease